MEVQCIGKGLRTMQLRVLHLDDSVHTFNLSINAIGLELYASMIERLHLLEADYFDLEFVNDDGLRCWLDREKPIVRQLNPGKDLIFRFGVKFYTPHPNLLEEEFTRYLFALQIKRDLISGTLLCSENTAALLASYIVQAEIGDFIEEDYQTIDYLRPLKLLHEPNEIRLKRIMEFHKAHIGLLPSEADFALLDTARKVEFYGVRLHFARDNDGLGLNLAVTHLGVLVFQNLIRINTLSWAAIRKLSFKRRRFLVKLHAERHDNVEFTFDSRDECKLFWRNCIEHHTFFRCPTMPQDLQKRSSVASAGNSFRYSGRTQQELMEYVKRHSEYRMPFKRPSAARRVNPNAQFGSNYPSRRFNSASMQLRSSSADRRSFLLKSMGAGMSSTLGRPTVLKRAQSMAAGALGGDEGIEVSMDIDVPGAMTTSGYATMAGSAGSGQSTEAKLVAEKRPDSTDEDQQDEQQLTDDGGRQVLESHGRMTGDWEESEVRVDSGAETIPCAKSVKESPRTSAAASLTQLNTQLDAFLQSRDLISIATTTTSMATAITTNVIVEPVNPDENGFIYCQPNEESPQRSPESSDQRNTETRITTFMEPDVTGYQQIMDVVQVDSHTTVVLGTSTVTSSESTQTALSTDSIARGTTQTASQPSQSVAQPDVISHTEGLHSSGNGRLDAGGTILRESNVQGTSLTTFLTDIATPIRLDQACPASDYSITAMIGPPVASTNLSRVADAIPNVFEFRAQDGLFILPTVTQFGLEINMDRQETRPVDSSRQTIPISVQSSISETMYGAQTGSMMDAVMHWYTRPEPATLATGTTTTNVLQPSFGIGNMHNKLVDFSSFYPRTSVAYAPDTTGNVPPTASTAHHEQTQTSVSELSGAWGSHNHEGLTTTASTARTSELATEDHGATGVILTTAVAHSRQPEQKQTVVTESVKMAISPDQWSSSGSDSTNGGILRPDLASSLSRITQHSTGCPHATAVQSRNQSIPVLLNTVKTAPMHSKAQSTNLPSNQMPILPLNTLPSRPQHRSNPPIQTHTCARGHSLSQSIPCSVHLSGLDTGFINQAVLAASRKSDLAVNPSGFQRKPQRSKDTTELEDKHGAHHRPGSSQEQQQQQESKVLPADMVLLNGINAATNMLQEEVPYVVMRRPRSVDVKQYQMHLQRQQQQAAALAAAAAGYPLLHPGASAAHYPHHVFPSGEQAAYPYGSRLPPVQPQFAYNPMLPAVYPPAAGRSRERSGDARKSTRRATDTRSKAIHTASAYPEVYYHGIPMRHGALMMPYEAESSAPAHILAPYGERSKCKAKRKHSKSRTEPDKLEQGSEQIKSRSSKIPSAHMPVGLTSPPSSSAMLVHHRPPQPLPPQHHHHMQCAHRQPGLAMETTFGLQPRPIAHSRRHLQSRAGDDSAHRATEVSATTSSANTRQMYVTDRSSKRSVKSSSVKKTTAEQEDERDMEVPYPVAELFVSPSRNTQPDDIQIAKSQPVRRHHHHPACASLMGRLKTQAQRDPRKPDISSIPFAVTQDSRVPRVKSKPSVPIEEPRKMDKLSRATKLPTSAEAIKESKPRESLPIESVKPSRDTRETIEKLREELRSAGFQVKDNTHHVPSVISPGRDSGRYKSIASTTKVAPAKKLPSKSMPKPSTSLQTGTSSSPANMESVVDRAKTSSIEQRTTDKLAERRLQSTLDGSFGVPPVNPIYLDSDSDSMEVLSSQVKSQHKSSALETPPVTAAVSTSSGTVPVTTSPTTNIELEVKLGEGEDGAELPDLDSGEVPTAEEPTGNFIGYSQSPRSHSPSLPLSFPLSEFDGSNASIVSSDASSFVSGASDYSHRSSNCDCLSSGSLSFASSCSYCHSHLHGCRSAHYHHRPRHHHSPSRRRRHHDHSHHASVSRSSCRCHRCIAKVVEYEHHRRHHSDHRDSRRYGRQRSHVQRYHSEHPHYARSGHSYTHRSGTSSHTDHRHHRRHASGAHARYDSLGVREPDLSAPSSSGASFGHSYSDYSQSQDSFDLNPSSQDEFPENLDGSHEAILSELKLRERKLRSELAKHRALANQLKEARQRTQKLLQLEKQKLVLETAEPSEMLGNIEGLNEEETASPGKKPPADLQVKTDTRQRISRRAPRSDGLVKGTKRGPKPETPSTSRSSDREPVASKPSVTSKRTQDERKRKPTVHEEMLSATSAIGVPDNAGDQSQPDITTRKEYNRRVLSESHSRHRRVAHRGTATVSKRGVKPQTEPTIRSQVDETRQKEVRLQRTEKLKSESNQVKDRNGKPNIVDDSDVLVIANEAALFDADEQRVGDDASVNLLGKAQLETVHEVVVVAEKAQPGPTRKPWDEREEEEMAVSTSSTDKSALPDALHIDVADVEPASVPGGETPIPPSAPPPLPFCITAVSPGVGDESLSSDGALLAKDREEQTGHGTLLSSFNRLTDLPDESTSELVNEEEVDAEYNGTRILSVLDGERDVSLVRPGDFTSEASEHLSQDSAGEYGERGILTDGSATTSGGDETHTSEASVVTVKPAHPSRETSSVSSTSSASEGSEEIEPFPSPPPEAVILDPYQGRTSPLTHAHVMMSSGLDEVIEEEVGAVEMESDAAAALAALDAATTPDNEEEKNINTTMEVYEFTEIASDWVEAKIVEPQQIGEEDHNGVTISAKVEESIRVEDSQREAEPIESHLEQTATEELINWVTGTSESISETKEACVELTQDRIDQSLTETPENASNICLEQDSVNELVQDHGDQSPTGIPEEPTDTCFEQNYTDTITPSVEACQECSNAESVLEAHLKEEKEQTQEMDAVYELQADDKEIETREKEVEEADGEKQNQPEVFLKEEQEKESNQEDVSSSQQVFETEPDESCCCEKEQKQILATVDEQAQLEPETEQSSSQPDQSQDGSSDNPNEPVAIVLETCMTEQDAVATDGESKPGEEEKEDGEMNR